MNLLFRTTCWAALLCLSAGAAWATPLGTAFTYQGQLVLSGVPVNGMVSLRFSLWDAAATGPPPAGGSMIGSPQVVAGVPVANGLFTVQLNDAGQFGPNAFNGDARWLQIEVCTDAACLTAPTVLAPRQPVTATPYSQFSGGPWQLSGTSLSYANGNVGIGTPTPHAQLEVKSGFGTEALRFGLDASDYHTVTTGFHGAQPQLNFLGFELEHGSNDTRRVMTLQGDGNVGIGNAAPSEKLVVAGNIKLGGIGQYWAPASEENLRLLRGGVAITGVPFYGCCYSVSHPATGYYTVTFNAPFAGIPTVIGSGYYDNTAFIYGITASQFSVEFLDAAHNAVDDALNFIVMGPR